MSEALMMRRRALMQRKAGEAPTEKWDYEWDWKSGIMPPDAIYRKAEPAADGVKFIDFSLVFPDVKTDAVLRVKSYQVTPGGSPRQLIIRVGQKEGAKAYFGAVGEGNLQTNITNDSISNYPMRSMTEIEMRYKNGGYSLFADGTLVATGPGVKNNPYLYHTGLDAQNRVAWVIAEIKWRGN